MSWNNFLVAICQRKEYELTPVEIEVLMCLDQANCPTKHELLTKFIDTYVEIEEEAFTQRLKNIYKKFQITGAGYKLPQLHKFLVEQYLQYQNKDVFFAEIGLTHVYPNFPRDVFGQEIDRVINSTDHNQQRVDILQTFAPNLSDYFDHITRCIQNNVQVRILLAWPYSEAAKLRENVLRRYNNSNVNDELNISDCVIANLELLEQIIKITDNQKLLRIKLYDTLPSLAIYRAGDYILAAPFLHGSLAVDTFQLELRLNTANQLLAQTLHKDFELMWHVARRFYPDPHRNWRNDLKILFTDQP
jgi:hypothetical protein